MIELDAYKQNVESVVGFLRKKISSSPKIVIILGTGQGALSTAIENPLSIPCKDIPHFPRATVAGHDGNLVFGKISGRDIAVLQGRFHFYEGYSTREITLPLRVLSLLGAKTLIAVNAAGGLNPDYSPGTIMVFSDHINLIPDNPLRGPNIDDWGPRFPDMSAVYDRELMGKTLECARRLAIEEIRTGIYVSVPGPSLETPAETRFLRQSGADAVGMSTVPEIIVARHAGMKILGLSLIANVNDPDNFRPILLEEVISQAEKSMPILQKLITEVLKEI